MPPANSTAVTSGSTFENYSVTTSTSSLCQPIAHYGTLYYVIVPIAQILINIFVVAAALHGRRNLRHNFVYIYVINVLIANIFFGIFSAYHLLNNVFAFEKVAGSDEPYNLEGGTVNQELLKGWWVFRSGFLVGLFLASSGGISALIYGIRESSYFVGRALVHVPVANNCCKRGPCSFFDSSGSKRSSRQGYRLAIIISAIWIVPLSLNIAASAGWSCVEDCPCTAAYYGKGIYPCEQDIYTRCSRMVEPQRNDFTLLIVIIWFLEAIGIVYLNGTTIQKYLKVTTTRKLAIPRISSIARRSVQDIHTSSDSSLSSTEDKPHDHVSTDDPDPVQHVPVEVGGKRRCCKLPYFNHNIKLLLTISLLFILCTLPGILVMLIDICVDDIIFNYNIFIISFSLCLIYCTISPILLVYFMPGLRASLLNIFVRCKCCTKTTITKRTASYNSQCTRH